MYPLSSAVPWGRYVENEIKDCLEKILEREGWPKYTDHPDDRGGPTKGGITLGTLRSWRGQIRLGDSQRYRPIAKQSIKISSHR